MHFTRAVVLDVKVVIIEEKEGGLELGMVPDLHPVLSILKQKAATTTETHTQETAPENRTWSRVCVLVSLGKKVQNHCSESKMLRESQFTEARLLLGR